MCVLFVRVENYVFINTFKMEMGQEEKRILCKLPQMALMEILFLLV